MLLIIGTLCFQVPIAYCQSNPRHIVPSAGATSVITLHQNWTDVEARGFYNMPQGSRLIPYDWFLNLEQPDSVTLFRETDHLTSLGYIGRSADEDNLDGLPIGFVRDGSHLGISCAACHTSVIRHGDKDYLIDGNQTHGDFESLLKRLVAAMNQTLADKDKFGRFVDRLLGPGTSDLTKQAIRQQLQSATAFRQGYNDRNLPKQNQPQFGPGRVDAFGAILNEVSSTFAKQPNAFQPANAPVSYPFLWDTPQHDKVQWNGAAPNTDSVLLLPVLGTIHVGALGRNAGEVLGVFGDVDASNNGALGVSGYPSSIRKGHLIQVEETLRTLWSPQWPDEFGKIDAADLLAGKALFKKHCSACHDDTFQRTSPFRSVQAKMDAVGTDQLMAKNFAVRVSTTGILNGRVVTLPGIQKFGASAKLSDMLVHVVQRVLIGPGLNVQNPTLLAATIPQYLVHAEVELDKAHRLSGEFKNLELDANGEIRKLVSRHELTVKQNGETLIREDSPFNLSRFSAPLGDPNLDSSIFDLANRAGTKLEALSIGTRISFDEAVPVKFAYKGRPLNGIWATAPYLHNGSVPTLDELLKAPDDRIKTFKIGAWEFDPDNVGFKSSGDFTFDTALSGNSNQGHDYTQTLPQGQKCFTATERRQLIAYLKSL